MAITAAMVKELRELTGAGMMDCKKALGETDGNMDEAVEYLRKNGQAKAEKKASRIAAEGLCTVVVKDDKTAAVVEVNSETDFVAKNETFQQFVKAVAEQAVESDAADMDAFMEEKWNEDPSKTVKDALVEKVAVIGENLKIRRFEKVVATNGCVVSYVHGGGRIGVIVEAETGFECTCGNKGCLETVASATGVVRLARHLAEGYEGDSSIKAAVDNGEQVTSKDIFVAAAEGDKFADSIVDKVSEYLGLATANISNILNPDSVVIGGGVSAAGEFLRSRVEGYFTRYAFPQVRRTTKVKLAELGNDAGIIGAASLALTIDN